MARVLVSTEILNLLFGLQLDCFYISNVRQGQFINIQQHKILNISRKKNVSKIS